MEFFTAESWLYDNPPIIGEIYRESVKYCYQQNLVIKNQMKVDRRLVDLARITAPFLNVITQKIIW
jgi:poly[(R)-3-hydroxyalkanoate] polymerase subunit PhaC